MKKFDFIDKSMLLVVYTTILACFVLWIWSSNASVKKFSFNEWSQDLQSSIQYKWYNQAVIAYKSQIQELINRWYSATRILDLLWIKSMECNRYDGLCKGYDKHSWNLIDVWPFQINKIHKEQFNYSLQLFDQDNRVELFKYQLSYANWLLQSYEDRFCWEKIFDQIWKDFTNERRFKCMAKSYNWNPTWKYIFSELSWEKRKMIGEWLVNNSNFKEYFNIN